MEGTYFFPIPEQASITEFAIWDGDRRLVGEVRSREEARRIYDEIVRRQRDPGLLEYAGKNLFQASIFPIPPHSDKKLELTYSQVLRAESGTVAYRYPLGTGRQMTQIGSVSGRIELDSKEPLRNIYSPTHAIEVKRNGDRRSLVSFESAGEPQDFQLFYALIARRLRRNPAYASRTRQGWLLSADDFAERRLVRTGIHGEGHRVCTGHVRLHG